MHVSDDAPTIKIAVMAVGRITVDGTPTTMDSLRVSLKQLAEHKGVVWYYREGGQSEPPPEAMEVIKSVIEYRLPIKLSSRPDFSARSARMADQPRRIQRANDAEASEHACCQVKDQPNLLISKS